MYTLLYFFDIKNIYQIKTAQLFYNYPIKNIYI